MPPSFYLPGQISIYNKVLIVYSLYHAVARSEASPLFHETLGYCCTSALVEVKALPVFCPFPFPAPPLCDTAKATNFILYYREQLWGFSLEELKQRKRDSTENEARKPLLATETINSDA